MDKMWVEGLSKPAEVEAARNSSKVQIERIIGNDSKARQRLAKLRASDKAERKPKQRAKLKAWKEKQEKLRQLKAEKPD